LKNNPEKFNYQGILRNTSGDLIKNTSVTVRVSLLQGSIAGTVQYSENHTVTTNNYGQFSVNIGGGTVLTGVFATINWLQPMFLKTEVANPAGGTFVDMGTTQLLSVPYALYAKNVENKDDADADPTNELQNLTLTGDTLKISNGNKVVFPYDSSKWAVNGNKLYYNTGNVGIGSLDPMSKLEVKSTSTTGALFQVINANNDTVFAVYPDGVKIFVDSDAKGKVGGFAISGRTPTKAGIPVEYFRVTPDSTRIYVNDSVGAKGTVGGFAISGRTPTKGGTKDYFTVNKDSARIYISDSVTSKGSVGGFAISGRTPTKSGLKMNDYFNISGNSEVDTVGSDARILWYPKKEAFLTGRVLVESPDSVGTNSLTTGFESKAVGNFSQAMGYNSIARGHYSTAIGYQALANDSNSFAFGNYAQALGKNSFAFGDSAIVESEDGYAIGAYAYTSGRGSFAIGSKDRNQHDVTYSTSAIGDLAFAIGLDADAIGDGSIVVGNESSASGINSVAIGRAADASADFSLALSYGTVTSTGIQSIAMGGGTASNSFSFAQGLGAIASGYISTAIGPYNEATSSYSLAMGYKGKTTGAYATAIGNNVTAQSYSSFVTGYYNIIGGNSATPTATDPLFVIGNGTYITPSNALTVLHNGNTGIGTATPNVKLDINGGIALRQTTPSSLSASVNNYNIGTGSYFRLTSSVAVNITGIANGVDGKVIIITNIGSFNITLLNANTSSTTTNRFLFSSGSDIILTTNHSITLIYDSVSQRWRDISLR
jgi:trimeric autotransporter adhesin